MTTPTLPGTIPGLLRRGSPVIEDDRIAVYLGADHYGYHYVADLTPKRGCGHRIVQGPVDLDLSDPTGRAHAAWWLNDHDEDTLAQAACEVSGVDDDDAWRWLIVSATSGDPLPDARVERLRLVCLHVAGVSRV